MKTKFLIPLVLAVFFAAGCAARSNRYYGGSNVGIIAAGAVIAGALIGQAFSDSKKQETLQDYNRQQTLLHAPCAYGGQGEAKYGSSTGNGNLLVISSKRTPENCQQAVPQVSVAPRVVDPYAICDRFPFLSEARLDCRRDVYYEIQWRTREAARQAAREAFERGYYR